VERCRYEAELAKVRYMQVDPGNRLVADALESDWNEKLRALTATQEQYDQQRQKDRIALDDASRQQVLALARDLPRLWRDDRTSDQDRKRMVRLLIEDVTLTKARQITAQIRFKGGATRVMQIPVPLNAWEARTTHPDVVGEIDRLLDTLTDDEIADELNRRGCLSGMKRNFNSHIVARIRRCHGLKCRFDRLREQGLLKAAEIAQQLQVAPVTVRTWKREGLLIGYPYNDKNECLYEPIGEDRPSKQQGTKLSDRRRYPEIQPDLTNEVHHGA
jgi:hypothetical protein